MTLRSPVGTPVSLLRTVDATALPRLLGAAGEAAAACTQRPLPRGDLAALAEQIRLRGRGGAGFPVARKLRVARRGRRTPVVVANAVESEPLSHKDATLVRVNPHLALDGVALAAHEVGTREAYVAVPEGADTGRILRHVVAERNDRVRVEIVDVPPGYVSSESGSLVSWLSGGPPVPYQRPPYEAERGVRGRPTLVHNVETLAQLALAARFGPDRFCSLGDPDEPGTFLLSVGGAVPRPGVYECASGTPLTAVLESAGQLVDGDMVVLTGGYQGRWLDADGLRTAAVSRAGMARAGGVLGTGVVFVLPDRSCPIAETARIVAYLARESAGQCGPCRFGLPALADAAGVVAWRTRGQRKAVGLIERWAAMVRGRGACAHPDGTVELLRSTLRTFAAHVEDHVRHGPCRYAHAPSALPQGCDP